MLCGWYGTETLGDKAILAATVSELRRLGPHGSIRIASLEPIYTRLTVAQMPELAGCEVIDVPTALQTIASCRALVFAGGPLMAIPQMTSMEALFRRAKHAGVSTILAGCGVGPLASASANRAIRGVLDAAQQRLFRDSQSLEAANRISPGVADRDSVCEDPAASWVATHGSDAALEPSVPTLGLGLRDWPSDEYARGMATGHADAVRAGFEAALLQAMEDLVADQPTLRILPIPFCAHDSGGDDRLLYWRLVGRASRKLRMAIDVSLISREPGPAEAVAAMARCRAFLSMRFHSLVFADTLGLPVVAVDYTLGAGKTHALAGKIGCPTLRIEDVRADTLLEALRRSLSEPRRAIRSSFLFPGSIERAWSAAGLSDKPCRESE
jgi:polysaccharide pyruvyl transferase WcaK-like protein